MKGAPECIFERCATIALDKENVAMTAEIKETAEKSSDALANTGK